MTSLCARTLPLLTIFLPILLHALFSASIAQAQKLTRQRRFNNSISAIFVFGDSTVDPGNNNYIGTPFKCNFPPYGRDFPNQIPTGRFTNGRLVTDFIASYAGIKEYVPPYLDPTLTLEDLKTGVSFASASSGYDPITSRVGNVISIQKQLDYFRVYKTRLETAIGKENTETLIKKAAFIVSAGTNDFVITYSGTPFRRKEYTTFSSYQQFLFQLMEHFTQGLLEQGARIIGFVGLPPMGCVPAVITLSGDVFHHRECVEELNAAARDYNQELQKKLKAMQNDSAKIIVYGEIYKPLNDMIQNPSKFGFAYAKVGCCGTGLLESSFLCNPKSYVCSDPSKYVFWDSIHPTETTYYNLFKSLRPTLDDVLKESMKII